MKAKHQGTKENPVKNTLTVDGDEDGSGGHRSCGAAAPGFDYATALANEQIFLIRQRMTLGLLVGAVAAQCLFAAWLPLLGYVLGVMLAAIAILTSAMDVFRWKRIDRSVGSAVAELARDQNSDRGAVSGVCPGIGQPWNRVRYLRQWRRQVQYAERLHRTGDPTD